MPRPRLFQHYHLAAALPIPAELGQPSRTRLALDLTSLEPVCVRLGPDPGPRILEFLDAFHHRRDAVLATSPRALSGGVHEEQSFVVEAWVTGAPLSALRKELSRSPRAASQVAWGLTRALADLHGQYLIHGDLHPGNVLVDRQGDLALVGDFPAPIQGPDTTLDPDAEARRYAAPEVDAGGPPSRRADVFSLGLLLFEVFEGRRLLARHRRGGFPVDPTLQAKIDRAVEDAVRIPPGLRSVVFQALRLLPDHRPPDAGEVLGQLIQAGGDIPTAEDRRTTLAPLCRRSLAALAPRWLIRPEASLDPATLQAAAAGIWRYSQAISSQDRAALRRGYQGVVDALWLALAAIGGSPNDVRRAEIGVALLWIHAATRRWHSRTLTFLTELLAARVLGPGNPLRMAMATMPNGDAVRLHLREKALEKSVAAPRSGRSLLTLAILDEGLKIKPGTALSQAKAHVLTRAGLTREALLHQAEGVLASGEAGEGALRELFELAAAALDHRPPSLPPRPDSDPSDVASSGTHSGVDLPELLEALSQVQELRRSPAATPSDPPREEDLEIDSGVPSGVDLDDGTLGEVDLDSSRDEIDPARISSSPGRSRGPDSTFSIGEEHAATLFSRGQALLAEDRLVEATEVFQELVGAGLLQRSQYRAALTSELRRLLWRAVHPRAPKATRVLVELWELCVSLHLDDMTSLCELLLLRRRSDAPVEVMLGRRPRSPHLLEACLERAQLTGQVEAATQYEVLLAHLSLDCGELAGALQRLQHVPPEHRRAEHAQAWQRMFQVAARVADAAAEYRRLQGELSQTQYAEYTVQRLAAFLEEYPFFGPAREHLVEVGLEHELPRRTGVEGVIQAEIHLLRQRPEHARRLLRRILELEHENEEALLLLAALAPGLEGIPRERALLRPHILAHEDAPHAAYHQALRGLGGGPDDVPLRDLLIKLCQRLGRSPAPHRLALGLAALEDGDPDRARTLCAAALAEAPDPRSLVDQMLAHPRVAEIYSRPELLALAEPPETMEA